jgi:murein DD-endopeptidase MepM/ murein hydrolase activator NlpD
MGTIKTRLSGFISRAFAPREFLIRSDGRVKYITITTRTQMLASVGAAALVGWMAYSSVSLLLNSYALSGKETEIQETRTAYSNLLAEVEKSYEQFRSIAQNLEDQQAFLSSMKLEEVDSDTAGPGYEQKLAQWQQVQEKVALSQEALREKVQLVETDLRSIAGQNQALTNSLVQLQEKLRKAEREKMRVADLGAHIGERLRKAEAALAKATGENVTLETEVAALREQVEVTKGAAARLTEAEAQLTSVIERNTSLETSVEYLQRKVVVSQFLEQQLAAAQDKLAKANAQNVAMEREVRTLQQQVEDGAKLQAQLAEAEEKLAGARANVAMLEDSVRSLELTVAAGREAQVAADKAREEMQTEMAKLEERLAVVNEENSQLVLRIQETEQALAAVVGQRDALQLARAELTGKVGGLEERLTAIQQSQQVMVQRIAEKTRQGVDEVEKTVAMTGLDVDELLSQVEAELGQGGPLIPFKSPSDPSVENDVVLASVAGLDDEVERWEKLQLVLRSMPLAAPLDQFYLASKFGRRIDPITRRPAVHEGLDMASALRSPVLATAPGKVVFAGWKGAYGRMVEIDHGLGIHTRYAHLHQITVEVGDEVDYREKVGLLGSSGRSTGPHVHYEVRMNGRPLDPANFLKAGKYVFKG